MSSTAISSAFSKASSHALSFCSTSETSSPFSGPTVVDRHGFLQSSHRVGGPNLCSLPARTTTYLPYAILRISHQARVRATHIFQQLSLEFIYVELVGRRSKVDPEPEPILTIVAVMPDRPNPDIWYHAMRRIQSDLQEDIPGISVELIEEKLYNGIYCFPVNRTHTIFPKWPSIVEYILSHCDTREWTSLECWRYGTDIVRQLNPVTVIIQVLETTTNPFITAARHIHGILALFDEANVDVLFQRTTNRPFVQNPTLHADACTGAIHPGVSLGIHQCSAESSTLGGFVQVQFPNDHQWHTFALTCFHNIWPPENHRNLDWLYEIENAHQAIKRWEFLPLDPRKPKSFPDLAERILRVDHPSLRDLNRTIEENEAIVAGMKTQEFLNYETEINKGEDGWLPDSARARYNAIVRKIQATEQTRIPFTTLRDSGNYFLGHVYAGSGINRTRKSKRSNREMKKQEREISTDWALVKIKPERLQPQQRGNAISGNEPFPYGVGMQFSGPFSYDPDFEPFATLELRKCGRSTGITSGRYNEMVCIEFTKAKSQSGQINVVPTWEHKIASGPDGDFIEPGDSGSWVYTLFGDVVGILKGGSEGHGTGTMTLMADIFDDIRSVTGATNVRIAPAPDV